MPVLLTAVLGMVGIVALVREGEVRLAPGAVAGPSAAPPIEAAPTEPPAFPVGPVSVATEGFLSWALLDRRTNKITGSANLAAPSDTMSMVKAWLAADYLRGLGDEQPPSARLAQLTIMIRDSDNAAAVAMYALVGGRASILRMIKTCRLTDSEAHPTNWSNTIVSARDTARLGDCIADGRAAGRRWTPWLLTQMRQVRGVGDFGVRHALPAPESATVAVKNGWLLRDEDGLWHIACMAVAERWSIGVLLRYPGRLGFDYGTAACEKIGAQLLAPALSASPSATGTLAAASESPPLELTVP